MIHFSVSDVSSAVAAGVLGYLSCVSTITAVDGTGFRVAKNWARRLFVEMLKYSVTLLYHLGVANRPKS